MNAHPVLSVMLAVIGLLLVFVALGPALVPN
jgi:hypothetical protein